MNALKILMIASATALSLGFATASDAEAGSKRWGFRAGFSNHRGSVNVGFNNGYRCGTGYVNRGWGRRAICPPAVVRPVHVHDYCQTSRRVWVEPVYRRVVTGYDCYGAPIYRRTCVREGYYRVARYNSCGCGHSVFLGY